MTDSVLPLWCGLKKAGAPLPQLYLTSLARAASEQTPSNAHRSEQQKEWKQISHPRRFGFISTQYKI